MKILERWKPVCGYEGLYEVSNTGFVRSLTMPVAVGRVARKNPKVLKARSRNDNGYLAVSLYGIDGKASTKFVHCLMAESFIGPRPEGFQCLHIDGNQNNLTVGNLRWGTPSENQQDRVKHGTDIRSLKHPLAKLSDDECVEIKKRRQLGEKGVDLAKEFNVTPSMISLINKSKVRKWIEL
jgi:hypothetical protein